MTNITCSNSITTVQQESNLQKTYFNISGKFYTKNTTFYIFLDNDVYEIPLDKLQVNGSSQATMQDGINALSAILVNAGTSALPVINNQVDLSADDVYLTGAGIYVITYFGNSFIFNATGIVDGSRVVLTNSNINAIAEAGITWIGISGVFYQGTQAQVTILQSGMTYEFIFDQASSIWYCLNPQPQINYVTDIGDLANPFDITTIGYYKFTNTGGGLGINLPSPSPFTSQEITIFNIDQTEPIVINTNQPIKLDGSIISQIPLQTCLNIVSIGGDWWVKNIYTV